MPTDVLIPVLSYPSVEEAVNWLTEAFGFGRRWQAGSHRAQLSVGQHAAIAITEGVGAQADAADHVMVRVDDVVSHRLRAAAAGASVGDATDHVFGERQYTALDFSGRQWVFTQSLEDVDPREWGATVADPKA